jgi:DNA-binding CsgD family transcriptional regulator
MERAIVGRSTELAAVAELAEAGPSTLQALVLEGEPGMGKTTLWREGVSLARERGLLTITAAPSRTEGDLPFAALGDLVEPLLDEVAALPAPLRTALEVALQQTAAADPPGQLAVARATLRLLEGARKPVVVAIDDVQWLDPASAHALAFALRRLRDDDVRALLARRSDRELPPPLELDRVLERDRLVVARVGPLTTAELDALLRARLELELPLPKLLRLHEVCGGNPFYALEIARAASEDGFRVPATLAEALEERLARLRADVRHAVLLAAAAGRPTARLVEQAAGSSDGLAAAVDAGVLSVDGERLRFTHPLFASVAYDSVRPWERREAHLALAAVAAGEERARNLALGTEEPDDGVAAELEEAAAAVAARGAASVAASLAEHAARTTPPADAESHERRLLVAAEQHFHAGDHDRSRSLLTQLAREAAPGPGRARLLARLSQVAASEAEGLGLCRRALGEVGNDAELEADLHHRIAASARRVTTLAEATEHARKAVALADAVGDPVQRARALGLLGSIELDRGAPDGMQLLEEAVAIEESQPAFPNRLRPSFLLGIGLLAEGALERARPLVDAQLERVAGAGDEVLRAICLSTLAELELRSGSWGRARQLAAEALFLLQQAAPQQDQAFHSVGPATVLAHMGDVDDGRRAAEHALAEARSSQVRTVEIRARALLTFVELSLGNHEQAVAAAAPALELAQECGLSALVRSALVRDAVESLVAMGELDHAERTNGTLGPVGQPKVVALHARGAAQIAAARGDEAAADRLLAEALDAHDRWPEPFELARTLLVRGRVDRRFKRRAGARDALERALEIFDDLGAPLWAETTASELARVPGRARASGELTETERRVAELVAEGLSNKEVAARLFVTVRTVEANLTKVYAKLGVRSRTELANRLHE